MSAVQLHTFVDHSPRPTAQAPGMVTRSLAEILPALAKAHEQGMAWLQDLADEPVQITADLAEVIEAFSDFCME